MPTIEISNEDESGSSFDLIDMLNILDSFARNLDWYFVDFVPGVFAGATEPRPKVKPWVVQLWHDIQGSKCGIKVTWDTLKDFARNVVQTDMALLVAVKLGDTAPSLPVRLDADNFEIVLQGIDAIVWSVTTTNITIIEQIRHGFKKTKVVQRTNTYY